MISIVFTILSELAFTFYVSNYGISNMLGHYAKIVSFYFIYRAVVKKNIIEPYDSIFRELNIQKGKLEKSNASKDRLFSIISHDLRGPLASVTGIIGSLDTDYDNISENDKKNYLREVNHSLQNIDKMLENLLSWAKIGMEGKKGLRSRNLIKGLLDEIITGVKPLYGIKGVNLVFDDSGIDDEEIEIDPDKFRVLINNILNNSMKFSEPGKSVTVTGSVSSDICRIEVEDEGIGMDFDPRMLENPVNESKSGTSDERGSGLGLYIINEFTRDNGGTLHIESTPGRGTLVVLEFPVFRAF